ncbi:serine hydrolase domain-containing protein [Sphingobacterium sp. HJSM2_6]|uniref:serine hydrolase domain-containing protein n=1 Tax=Sphingobacterium sp. HJSM2_6 TaxID=3366264 RepID=UPI003BEA9BE5
MKRIGKFFKYLSISLISVLALIIIALYIFRVDYILKGIYVTYLHGHQTAYLSDYKHFDNHTIAHQSAVPWPKSTRYNQKEINDTLKSIHEKLSSVAYLIIHRDSLIVEEYYQGYTDSTRSNSFSMAKSIVSAILGKAIADGYITSINQKVKDFVPEITGPYADSITFKNLVSMSSGMKWKEAYYDPFSITTRLYFDKNIVGALEAMPIEAKPGTLFKYQSGDTQLLGIAIQRATKKSLSQLLSDYFWKPMQAEHDALWQVDSKKQGIEKAYCCIASNAKDFARFGKLYLQHGKWNNQQLLDSSYVQESLTPVFEESTQYGYGWWLGHYKNKPYFYMDGHLGQFVIVIPADDLIIVRLGNQLDQLAHEDPRSAFYNFIDAAYQIID